jgi:uncharacterized damage-inducible protein DinB
MFRTKNLRPLLALVALVALAAPAVADHHEKKAMTVKDEMMFWINDAEDKLTQLAEATPAEKYAWSPGEGVRKTGQVFLHVAAANYGLPSAWGVAAPEGFDFQKYEASMSKKEDIQAALKASFAHMKKSLESADDAALTKQVNLFGMMDTSVRGAYMMLLSHAHEHLGQSIAYARSNGITPPWTAKMNEKIEAASKEAQAKDPHAGHKH